MSFSPREELGSTAPQEGNRGEEASPCRFDPYLALESSGKGGFGELGFGVREGTERASVRE